ncbi:hypothetical protein WJX73_004338 [Symbiochloris irregularis]|uniref:Uncharacterized protein n=1 Tax=Symbiochloris irregularis TaxID=706552 RepID=A0AAW1NSL7_9CHLO
MTRKKPTLREQLVSSQQEMSRLQAGQELFKAQLAGSAQLAAAHSHLKKQAEATTTQLHDTEAQLATQTALSDDQRATLEELKGSVTALQLQISEQRAGAWPELFQHMQAAVEKALQRADGAEKLAATLKASQAETCESQGNLAEAVRSLQGRSIPSLTPQQDSCSGCCALREKIAESIMCLELTLSGSFILQIVGQGSAITRHLLAPPGPHMLPMAPNFMKTLCSAHHAAQSHLQTDIDSSDSALILFQRHAHPQSLGIQPKALVSNAPGSQLHLAIEGEPFTQLWEMFRRPEHSCVLPAKGWEGQWVVDEAISNPLISALEALQRSTNAAHGPVLSLLTTQARTRCHCPSDQEKQKAPVAMRAKLAAVLGNVERAMPQNRQGLREHIQEIGQAFQIPAAARAPSRLSQAG